MEPVIQTRNLVHEYKGGVRALKGVDIDIHHNDVVSIIGQNGSGKTTLVRHFNGLLKPTEGTVTVDGEDTEGKSVSFLSKKVGYAFQNPNHQFFCETVKDELLVGPKNFKFSETEAQEKLEYVVDLLEIEDILTKHPMTLDYTRKKIVSIASILTFSPKVVIMDEPTGGLDEDGRKILKNTMDLLHEQGNTVIMISHDMDFVAENTNRVIVMAEGQVLMDADCQTVFRREDVLKKAWIEPPQITQLGNAVCKDGIFLSVNDFVTHFKNRITT
ncbi:energy-coupling factor ABC transporter ATP-binding protein [Evansella tamaricis]|uniref:Energy-coupling factor ABC transporter ATP-binding protein n=1 Tax=Evansella tamaricis TaxID=2069301 RepID=A0ABS6JA13_9BACI|nr:energy-coupling factor ABC transporter ATP-binding protein [Evansella tamaricis]